MIYNASYLKDKPEIHEYDEKIFHNRIICKKCFWHEFSPLSIYKANRIATSDRYDSNHISIMLQHMKEDVCPGCGELLGKSGIFFSMKVIENNWHIKFKDDIIIYDPSLIKLKYNDFLNKRQ